MIKKLLIFLFVFLPVLALAEGTAEKQVPKAEYLFHLYYDNGQLSADRDFQFKYDIITEEFIQGEIKTQFPYRGEIINVAGEVAAHFIFDPKNGDIRFNKGKISVKAPYVADGQKAVFYDPQNNPVLTIPVSDSSFCNDNGVCDDDRGEDSLNCPKDCKQAVPVPPVASGTPTPGGGNSAILSSIIYGIIGVILLGGFWWLFKRRRAGTPSVPSTPVKTQPLVPPPPTANTPINSGKQGNVDIPGPPSQNNPV